MPIKASKKSASKKSAVSKSGAGKRLSAVSAPFKKSELLNELADASQLARKEVNSIIESLHQIIEAHVKKSGPGAFVMPGLFKIQIINKPATKARKGVNPFTGEEMTFKAKPARKVVKVRPLKRLKEMV